MSTPLEQKKPIMVIAVSQASTMATLGKGQVEFFTNHGFDVYVFAKADGTEQSVIDEGARFYNVDFKRALSPLADLKNIITTIKLFSKIKPDAIQLMTTKPCFVGGIAGRLSSVPLIIRHKWGYLRECNYTGLKRFLLFATDKLCNIMAHRVVAICHKLLEAEIKAGAVNSKKAVVFGSGSSNGLDLDRFKRTPELIQNGQKIRDELGLSLNDPVLGTVMRINVEKGITELVKAFQHLSQKHQTLRLLIIGDYDIRNLPGEDIINEIKNNPRIHTVGFQEHIEEYYAAMNIFVMPSYREGFCKSNIEASGMELPVVASNIIGCSESVKNGVSGILVPPRTTQPLADAIEKLLLDNSLAKKLGTQGRERVENEFDQKYVWHNQLRDICQLLRNRNIPLPIEPEEINAIKCPLCDEA